MHGIRLKDEDGYVQTLSINRVVRMYRTRKSKIPPQGGKPIWHEVPGSVTLILDNGTKTIVQASYDAVEGAIFGDVIPEAE